MRLFPKNRSMQLENVWKEKYGKKIQFSKENKENSIYNSKIIILDDFSHHYMSF